jgi:glyceraldehyde 3-phosphate dehydrogenase
MTTRIGINGFGRMGRLVVRALRHHPELELVHVNERKGGLETAAHLLEFDSVHGRYPGTVGSTAPRSWSTGPPSSRSPSTHAGRCPWAGARRRRGASSAPAKFRTIESLEPYFDAGVRKVVVAAPVKSPRCSTS